jgi:hypothetical protein
MLENNFAKKFQLKIVYKSIKLMDDFLRSKIDELHSSLEKFE